MWVCDLAFDMEYCTVRQLTDRYGVHEYPSGESTQPVLKYLRSTMDRPIHRFFFPGSGTCPLSYWAVVCGWLGFGEGWFGSGSRIFPDIIPGMARIIAGREGAVRML